jgi:hypothetical protein
MTRLVSRDLGAQATERYDTKKNRETPRVPGLRESPLFTFSLRPARLKSAEPDPPACSYREKSREGTGFLKKISTICVIL